MKNEIINLMRQNQIQIYELWLNFFRKKEYSKKVILKVIAYEIEDLKKQIEPQKKNFGKKAEFNK